MYRLTPVIPYPARLGFPEDRLILKFAQPIAGAIERRFEAAGPPFFVPPDRRPRRRQKEIAP